MTEHEMRLKIQEYDCTYGDNPLLIHCPIDKPCMKHKYQKALDKVENALKEYGNCEHNNYMTGMTCVDKFKNCIFCEAIYIAREVRENI